MFFVGLSRVFTNTVKSERVVYILISMMCRSCSKIQQKKKGISINKIIHTLPQSVEKGKSKK